MTVASGSSCAAVVCLCQHHDVVGEASGGAHELVDGAGGGELVESAERGDDGLFDVFAFAVVFGDLEIVVFAGLFYADEHGASPVLTPHIVRQISELIGKNLNDIARSKSFLGTTL